MGFDHGTWMLGGWLMVLAVWLIPFLLAYVFLADRFKSQSSTARDLLDEAYARGDLSRDEYLKRRNDIGGR